MFFVIAVMVFTVMGGLVGIWVWGLIHCRNNPRLSQVEMERWLLFIALVPALGAAIYLYKHRHDPFIFPRPPLTPHR